LSWNGSTEGAETVTASLPILKAAERVTVLTVDGGTVAGPDGGALRDYLGVHDIDAKHVHETGRRSRPGEAILDFAKREGADLLIKSAYTHSRLRQMVFGGATATILAEATLPVFMAN
ncbi:MAG: universal stress protein, partial [Pseudomonadota bacterium]